ncbi:polysaccharide biosynthesis/export family protein, partial [Bacteroides sp.]|nr:polysaccharide biosynthesis/export family protein [Bacteroides sp.]
MHRFITLFLLVFMFSGAVMAQNMSDDQVIQYVKEAQKQGKTEKQITTELMRQGVTKEQVERIKKKHEDSDATKVKGKDQEAVSRQRGDKKVDEEKYKLSSSNTLESDFDRRRGDTDQREVNVDQSQEIFGHNIFTNQNLTFEPNINIATPTNYRLGPGDEVIIDVWGASETTIRQTISPEGSIHVSSIGPVYLSGLTI